MKIHVAIFCGVAKNSNHIHTPSLLLPAPTKWEREKERAKKKNEPEYTANYIGSGARRSYFHKCRHGTCMHIRKQKKLCGVATRRIVSVSTLNDNHVCFTVYTYIHIYMHIYFVLFSSATKSCAVILHRVPYPVFAQHINNNIIIYTHRGGHFRISERFS